MCSIWHIEIYNLHATYSKTMHTNNTKTDDSTTKNIIISSSSSSTQKQQHQLTDAVNRIYSILNKSWFKIFKFCVGFRRLLRILTRVCRRITRIIHIERQKRRKRGRNTHTTYTKPRPIESRTNFPIERINVG